MPGMGGGAPSQAEIEAAQQQLGQMGGMPGLGGGAQLPPGLSGFGKKK